MRLLKWVATCAATSSSWVITHGPAHAGWVTSVPTHTGVIRVASAEIPPHPLVERTLEDGSALSGLLLNDPGALVRAPAVDRGGRLPLGAAASGLATVLVPPSGQDIAAKHMAAAVTTWQDTPAALRGPAGSGLASGVLGGNRLPPSLSGVGSRGGRTAVEDGPSPTAPGKPAFDVLVSDHRGDLTCSLASAAGGTDALGVTNLSGAGIGGPLVTPPVSDLPRTSIPPLDSGGGLYTPKGPGDTPPADSGLVSPAGLDPVPAPEPAGLSAAGIGLAGALGYGWVRRRKGAAPGEGACPEVGQPAVHPAPG